MQRLRGINLNELLALQLRRVDPTLEILCNETSGLLACLKSLIKAL